MTSFTRTLLLLGLTGTLAAVSGCVTETRGRGNYNGNGTCADYQYFTVDWTIDHGINTPILTCGQAPPSHVEVTTSAGDVLTVGSVVCGSGFFTGATVGGIQAGTTDLAANLISDTDGSILSPAPVPPNLQVAMPSCAPAALSFQFELP